MEIQEKPPSTFETTEPEPYLDRGQQLPEHYSEDKLVAMVRDPYCIFLYWDLEGTRGYEARSFSKLEGRPEDNWALKVISPSDQTNYFVPVQHWVRNWYIQVTPAKRYYFELGYFESNGDFTVVITSREVETPRACPSDDISQAWAHFFKDFLRGKLIKKQRIHLKAVPPTIHMGVAIPGLAPEPLPPLASPEAFKKEYVFRP